MLHLFRLGARAKSSHVAWLSHRPPIAARFKSSPALSANELAELFSKPSWSVKSLQARDRTGTSTQATTRKELHHLLRLSALPLPTSAEEEASMIDTLESQLHFVQAIQSVDTTGIEPLQSIRDESAEAEVENEINLNTLKEELEKECTGGFARRITRKSGIVDTSEVETGDPLGQAPKKIGRFIAVDTKRS